jgi:hypothetical protein
VTFLGHCNKTVMRIKMIKNKFNNQHQTCMTGRWDVYVHRLVAAPQKGRYHKTMMKKIYAQNRFGIIVL